MKPKISVITATYNRFDRLIDTIQSVLDQTYPNIEYIISDDGSSNFPYDKVVDYIEKNRRDNLTYQLLINKSNVGTVRNLNNAIKSSNGDYVFMLSGNDIFYSNDVIEKIMDIFVSEDCDVISTSRLLYSGNMKKCLLPHFHERREIEKCSSPKEQHNLYVSGKILDMASGSSLSYSKRILKELNFFDERYTLLEDSPFVERFLRFSMIKTAYDIISIYYQEGGISRTKENSKINKVYEKDIVLYKYNQRFECYKLYNKKLQKQLSYSKELFCANSNLKRMKTYICNLRISIGFYLYKKRRKLYTIIDRAIIRHKNL